MNEPCCTQRGCYSTSTCYLCFSCFCFSFSGFPSLDCWWTAAWRHSRAQLLQTNNIVLTNPAICKGKFTPHRVKMPSSWQQHCRNVINTESTRTSCDETQPCSLRILYSVFIQHFLCYSLENDVILNWNKPHLQTTTEGKEGPAWKQWIPAHLNASTSYHSFLHYKKKQINSIMHICKYCKISKKQNKTKM